MATQPTRWTKEQLIVTLDVYCRTPFGRLHRSNPDVIALAGAIGRTPSAVAMKLVNFASFDIGELRFRLFLLRTVSDRDADGEPYYSVEFRRIEARRLSLPFLISMTMLPPVEYGNRAKPRQRNGKPLWFRRKGNLRSICDMSV